MSLTMKKLIEATKCSESSATLFIAPLNLTIERYGIKSKEQVAMFLAQIGHESASFKTLAENLNYSKEGLLKVFPKYFTNAEASIYARRPELIANRVYANRMGNGSEASGDGWKYRGRGLIQITGKDNYTRMSKSLNLDLVRSPDALKSPLYASLSAGQYWEWRGLKDISDIKIVTKKINGGYNGLADREKRYAIAIKALSN